MSHIETLGLASSVTQEEYAAAWLNRSILIGDLVPGARLGQDDIAKRIGMSSIPVREAFKRLAGEGQLTYIARKGYVVAQLTAREMRDVYDLRGVLEDHLLVGSMSPVVRVDIDLLNRIRQKCTDALAAGDILTVALGHWEFFGALFIQERNPRAVGLVRQLWQVTNAYASPYYRSKEGREIAENARALIVAALDRSDEEAMLKAVRDNRARSLALLVRFAKDAPALAADDPPPA